MSGASLKCSASSNTCRRLRKTSSQCQSSPTRSWRVGPPRRESSGWLSPSWRGSGSRAVAQWRPSCRCRWGRLTCVRISEREVPGFPLHYRRVRRPRKPDRRRTALQNPRPPNWPTAPSRRHGRRPQRAPLRRRASVERQTPTHLHAVQDGGSQRPLAPRALRHADLAGAAVPRGAVQGSHLGREPHLLHWLRVGGSRRAAPRPSPSVVSPPSSAPAARSPNAVSFAVRTRSDSTSLAFSGESVRSIWGGRLTCGTQQSVWFIVPGMHPPCHRVNTTATLDATSAKPPSQTAPGGSLPCFPNFRVYVTWFCSWGPRLDTGQYFRE